MLRVGGRLTVLHDEYRYCCLLARTVATLNSADGTALYESVLGLRGKGKTKKDSEDVDGIRLYHGIPGKKEGHAGE